MVLFQLHAHPVTDIERFQVVTWHLQPSDAVKHDQFLEVAMVNVAWLGGTGCGKTGLATSFLIQAIQQGARGRYVLFTDLLNELHRSQADRSQNQVIRRYVKYDLLLIDEIGYAEAEPSQVGLFFTLLQKRHKQRSTLITSNLGFEDWNTFLKNPSLTAALIDRLTENSHVFNLRDCVSLRPTRPADPA